MLSLCRIDAAFRRLHEYDPDLDVSLLSMDDGEMTAAEREEISVQARIIRMTLVARIADIVKQAATESSSLDTAVSMVEVLISTYSGYGERPGRGHEHATQAIQLLASIYSRFDEAVDLFFDLVERFCAQGRTRGTIEADAAICADVIATRMMQNYDQTLLKLISKHWNAIGPLGNWDIFRPLDRIKALRDVYEMPEGSKASIFSFLRRKDSRFSLFCESQKVLRKIQKERVSEMVYAASDGRVWMPRLLASRRSPPSLRTDRTSQERNSNETKTACVTVKEVSEEGCEALETHEEHRGIIQIDAFVDAETEVKVLYTIAEKSESREVVEIQPFPDFESLADSEGPRESDKARLKFHHPFKKPIAPS